MTPSTSAGGPPPVNDARLALTYYGDDFTGSTDVMEALSLAGLPTVLFLDAPTPEQVALHPDAVAVGVAGISRTMSPDEMDATLPGILGRLAELDAPVFHYKICSTFDSSPEVGSIGRAAEIVRRVFPGGPVPLVVGVPELGRYCAFGTLFATAGHRVHRLDRHPTMTTHPVTPMTESDLIVHLATQTDLPLALVDLRTLVGSDDVVDVEVDRAMTSGAAVVLFDLVDTATERQVGRWDWCGATSRIPTHAMRTEVWPARTTSTRPLSSQVLARLRPTSRSARRWRRDSRTCRSTRTP